MWVLPTCHSFCISFVYFRSLEIKYGPLSDFRATPLKVLWKFCEDYPVWRRNGREHARNFFQATSPERWWLFVMAQEIAMFWGYISLSRSQNCLELWCLGWCSISQACSSSVASSGFSGEHLERVALQCSGMDESAAGQGLCPHQRRRVATNHASHGSIFNQHVRIVIYYVSVE